MYSMKQYTADTLALTNSLIIKFSGVALSVNNGLLINNNISRPDNYKDWKYYMNLSGVKHTTNNDVYITLIETNTKELLTPYLLKNNPETHNELLKFKERYKLLISEYPDDIVYIRGCILPVDINTAINAREGTILNYSSIYVGEQELSLIRELNTYTQSFFVRWYIKEYLITDELYAASVLGSLLCTIPAKIINMRLNKVKTSEVHDFHLENFFRSKLNIWDQLVILKKETIIWLYTNIDYLMKYTGRRDTLQLIADKVLDPNGIGLGEYILTPGRSDINTTATVLESGITKQDNYLTIKELNNSYDPCNKINITIPTMTEMTASNSEVLSLPATEAYVLNNHIESKVLTKNINKMETKFLDVNYGEIYKTQGSDTILVVLDTWLITSSSGVYDTLVEFKDPNDNTIYNLTPLQGYYMFIYFLLGLTENLDKPITTITYTASIDYNLDISKLVTNLFNEGMFSNILTDIKNNIPTPPSSIDNIDKFNKLINDIKKFLSIVWIIDSNINNAILSSGIKHLAQRILTQGTHTIPGSNGVATMIDLLKHNGVNIITPTSTNYNYLTSLKAIYKLFTKCNLSELELINSNTTIINTLLNKLTSYTVQPIKTNVTESVLYAPYSTIENLSGDQGLINISGASVKGAYELDTFYVISKGHNFTTTVNSVTRINNTNISLSNPLTGYCQIANKEIELIATPIMCTEIVNGSYTPYSPTGSSNSTTVDNTVSISGIVDNSTVNTLESIPTSILHTDDVKDGTVDNIITPTGVITII